MTDAVAGEHAVQIRHSIDLPGPLGVGISGAFVPAFVKAVGRADTGHVVNAQVEASAGVFGDFVGGQAGREGVEEAFELVAAANGGQGGTVDVLFCPFVFPGKAIEEVMDTPVQAGFKGFAFWGRKVGIEPVVEQGEKFGGLGGIFVGVFFAPSPFR